MGIPQETGGALPEDVEAHGARHYVVADEETEDVEAHMPFRRGTDRPDVQEKDAPDDVEAHMPFRRGTDRPDEQEKDAPDDVEGHAFRRS